MNLSNNRHLLLLLDVFVFQHTASKQTLQIVLNPPANQQLVVKNPPANQQLVVKNPPANQQLVIKNPPANQPLVFNNNMAQIGGSLVLQTNSSIAQSVMTSIASHVLPRRGVQTNGQQLPVLQLPVASATGSQTVPCVQSNMATFYAVPSSVVGLPVASVQSNMATFYAVAPPTVTATNQATSSNMAAVYAVGSPAPASFVTSSAHNDDTARYYAVASPANVQHQVIITKIRNSHIET